MEAQKCDLCRLCLGAINGRDEILLNENHYLIKTILLITGLEVASDPGQREYICSQCHAFLEQCVEFRITCINNDGVFHEMMIGPNYAEDCRSELQKLDTNQLRVESLYNKEKELQKPVVEYIKQEPLDLEEQADDANESSGNIHVLPHEEQPSVARNSEAVYEDGTELFKAQKNYPWKIAKCQQCGKVMDPCKLSKHLETHNPNRKKRSCPYCPKKYVKAKNLQDHIHGNHTQGVQYACEQCRKSYTTRQSFLEHQLAVHSGEKRYACSVCGERFARGSSKSYHQRTAHSTLRPFACEFCDKTFKTKSHLTDHIRFHMGYRRDQRKRPRCDTSKISQEQQRPSITTPSRGFPV